jgi:hypothetical protein
MSVNSYTNPKVTLGTGPISDACTVATLLPPVQFLPTWDCQIPDFGIDEIGENTSNDLIPFFFDGFESPSTIETMARLESQYHFRLTD